MGKYRTHTRVCAFICILTGIWGLVYGSWMTVDVVGKHRHGERVEAQIVKSLRRGRPGAGKGWYSEITVRYTDRQGVLHEVMPPINDSNWRLTGETVAIYLDADDPEDIILDAWASRYAPPLLPFLCSLIFLPGGCLLWRACNKGRRNRRCRAEAQPS